MTPRGGFAQKRGSHEFSELLETDQVLAVSECAGEFLTDSRRTMEPTSAAPGTFSCFACLLPQHDYPPAVVTFMFSSIITGMVADLVSNFMVILAVKRNKKLQHSGNVFVVSLCVADLLVAIYPYPLMLHTVSMGGLDMRQLQCQIVGIITLMSMVGSVFNILVMAFNRYCYICHNIYYKQIFTARNTALFMIATWVATILAILPNVYYGIVKYEPHAYTCVFDYTKSRVFNLTMVSVHFILPLLTVSFFYWRIWKKVLAVQNQVEQDPDQLASARNFLNMFVVFLLFAVCWCPLNTLTVLGTVGPKEMASTIPNWLYLVAYLLAHLNSCANALIYGFFDENFRQEYRTIYHVIRHPLLYFSGVISDYYDTPEDPGPPPILAHVGAREDAIEDILDEACKPDFGQDHSLALALPAIEEIPVVIHDVPLPGDAAAGHLDEAPVIPRSPFRLASPACRSVRRLVSRHFRAEYFHFSPASVHLRGDFVYFQAESVYFRSVSCHIQSVSGRVSAGSYSKFIFNAATSRRRRRSGTFGLPAPPSRSAAGLLELVASQLQSAADADFPGPAELEAAASNYQDVAIDVEDDFEETSV
ncbi:melatonin-related receptor [Carlito syrichta]|uniref:Melatonin-related receptor n=1 Tax=Carlito syrichta TaxID=1868482 RepID=A0A3Q0DVS8_CARSF|nr:melatonin-related receptor [Carlito syrichta]